MQPGTPFASWSKRRCRNSTRICPAQVRKSMPSTSFAVQCKSSINILRDGSITAPLASRVNVAADLFLQARCMLVGAITNCPVDCSTSQGVAINLLFSGAQPDERLRNDTEANVMWQYALSVCEFEGLTRCPRAAAPRFGRHWRSRAPGRSCQSTTLPCSCRTTPSRLTQESAMAPQVPACACP
jgi:hypothetical protein